MAIENCTLTATEKLYTFVTIRRAREVFATINGERRWRLPVAGADVPTPGKPPTCPVN